MRIPLMSSARARAVLCRAILVAAVAACVYWAATVPAIAVDDSESYLAPAYSWSEGRAFGEGGAAPLQDRLPVYPAILGIALTLAGGAGRVVTATNVLLHVGAVLAVRSAVADRDPIGADALAAAALVYPSLLWSTALVLQESAISFFLAAVFLLSWRAIRRASAYSAVGAGIALGAASLAKTIAVPFVVPLATLVVLAPPRSLRRGAVLVAAFATVLGVWAFRSHLVLGRWEIVNTNAGHTFLGGTVSNQIEDWSGFAEYTTARADWERGHRPGDVLDRYLFRVGLRRIAAAPGRWAVLVAGRLARFMLPARHWMVAAGLVRSGTFPWWYSLLTLFHLTLFASTGWLALRAWMTRNLSLWICPLIVLGHQASYAVAYVSPRYAVTVGPLLFGGLGLAASEWRHQRPVDNSVR